MRSPAIRRSSTGGPVTNNTLTSPPFHSMYSQHPYSRPSAEIRQTPESHPHETSIEIGSLNVIPAAQPRFTRQLAKFPGAISKVFHTQYFRLYRPLETWHERGLLFSAIFLSLMAGVPLPIIGVIFGKIINGFPPDEDALETRLLQLIGVAIAYFFITWGWATCWGIVGEKVARRLREQVLQKAMGMDMTYFEVEGVDIAHRLTADTQTIQLGVSEKCGLFLQSISYFIAAFTTGFTLNAQLTGILFIAVIPPIAVIVIYGTTTVSKYAQRAQNDSAKAASIVEGAIGAVQVVQAFGALDRLAEQHLKLMGPVVSNGIRKSVCGALMLGAVYFVAYAANALAFYKGSRIIASGGFDAAQGAGTVYTVIFLILDASFVIGQFGPFLQTFALAAAAGRNVLAIIDHPDPVINAYSRDGVRLPVDKSGVEIELKDVSFSYPARPAARVLDNVTLNFKAGAFTAIVGPSGSGKSTIASLLLRFYDPNSGSIIVGGHDLRTLNLRDYRSCIALVDQEPVLFAGTVMDNIRHGLLRKAGSAEEEILRRCYEAARDANAYDFIMRLPQGFDTKVGGTGTTQLSGGQKQRIAIARAIVGDPAVLILDEPTSALDATGEAVVLEALERATSAAGRTTIMIAHRLATVKAADTIIVMAEGQTAEQGSHLELMAKGGTYSELVEAQKLLSSSSSHSSHKTKVGEIENPAISATKFETSQDPVTETQSIDEMNVVYSAGSLIRRSLEISKPDHWLICLGLFACMVTGGVITGESIIFGNLISTLNDRSDEQKLESRASFFSLMFFVLSLVAFLVYTTSGSAFGIVSERLIRRIRDKSLRTILRQDVSWFESPGHSPAHLVSMVSMDTGHLSGLSGVILGTVFTVLVSMTGGIALAHIIAWKVAVVILAAVPIMIVSGFLRIRILSKFEQRHEIAYLEAAGLAKEACDGMRTVAALGKEYDVIGQYHEAIEKPYRDSLRFIITGNVWLALSLAMTYFIYALAYWWGAKQVRAGFCSPLDFFIVLPALLFSAQASGQMFSLAPELTRAKTAASSVFKLHDQKPTIDRGDGGNYPLVREHTGTKGKVEFRDVRFTYKSRPSNPVLRGLSLTVQPGQFVALVGPSGAGKSSAIALLERFYDVDSGAVLVNDSNVRDMNVRDHRSRVSLVSQEACLFPGSVAFNIGLGASGDFTHEDIVRVCKMCGIHDFIMGLPEGYETNCGTNGSQLSGGQKQRVALARALIRDPEILLLDEATSALDSHSEKHVRDAIQAASKGRTCIAVAHRLASIQHVDCIYVLGDGRVVECGTHTELLAVGGVYASMNRQQTLS